MAKVILQPASKGAAAKHYLDTIENPVPLARMAPFLPEKDRAMLEGIYPDSVAEVWGVAPGRDGSNAGRWTRIQTGDLAFFAGDKRLFSYGRVTHKLHNAPLANELWGTDKDGDTWEYIYFLTRVQPLDISYAKLNKAAGYKPAYIVRVFLVLDEDKSSDVLEELELAVYPSEQEFAKAQKSLDALESLDAKREALVRIEQGYLRSLLFGIKQKTECGICGRIFPVGLLVAAHVKRRADCTLAEKLDVKAMELHEVPQ